MPALLKECSYERPPFRPQLIFTNLDMNVANINPAVGESSGGPRVVVHISGAGREEAACREAGGAILVGSDLQPQFPQLQLDPEHCPEGPVLLLRAVKGKRRVSSLVYCYLAGHLREQRDQP